MKLLNEIELGVRRRLRVILQTEAAECGLACLGMVASYHGRDFDLGSLRRRYRASQHGSTLRVILSWAQGLGLSGRALTLDLDSLRELRLPAILHWEMNHFVVLEKVSRSRLGIVDPGAGRRTLSLDECSNHFSGVAVELMPTLEFRPEKQRQRLSLSSFWSRATGLKRSLAQLFVATALLQIFALGSPFYMQLIVDEAIVLGDRTLVFVLAVGFALLAVVSAVTGWLRSQIVLHLGTKLSAQMSTSLFRHMLRLPLDFFERRHMGDIVSRFGSLGPIQDVLVSNVVGGVVDGLLGATTLVMMFAYSSKLAFVALGVTLAVTGSASLFLVSIRTRSREQIAAEAQESANLMETVRALQSIKSFGKEVDREALWQDLFLKRLNHDVSIGRLHAWEDTTQQVLQGLGQVGIVGWGAFEVLEGNLTLGMLFAFMSYRGQFAERVAAIVEHVQELYLAGLHLERLADIALAPPEEEAGEGQEALEIEGDLVLSKIGYRYSESDPWVIRNLSFRAAPGEMVVITGPSGQGKSTLLKLMMGLIDPSEGEVLVDGVPLPQRGRSRFRGRVAAVMQADRLLAGSFADNISFFDPTPDLERVVVCAQMACLHEEIARMPMQYNSLVGDMGTVLSAGQQQRLMLARAFYRNPRILFLDEGTANLDQALEARINDTLAQLNATVVVVAHRPDVFAKADRVLRLEGGKIVDVTADSVQALRVASDRQDGVGARLGQRAIVSIPASNGGQ